MTRGPAFSLASAALLAHAGFLYAQPATNPPPPPTAPTNAITANGTRLEYQRAPGAETCPNEETWRDALASKIEGGADPFTPSGSTLLRVTMERRPAHFRATAEAFDALGRSLGAEEQTAATCAEAANALARTVSILFLVFRPPSPTAPPNPAPPPPPKTAPPAAPPPAIAPPGRKWRVQMGLGAGGAVGFSPSLAAAFGGFVGVRFPLAEGESAPALSLSLEGRGDLESSGQTLSGPQNQTARLKATFAGGTLAPCAHGARFLLGCVLLSVGQVRATLADAVDPEARGSLFVGLGGRVGGEFPFLKGRVTLAARVTVDGWFALVRPGVTLDSVPIWTAPQGAGALAAHLVALF